MTNPTEKFEIQNLPGEAYIAFTKATNFVAAFIVAYDTNGKPKGFVPPESKIVQRNDIPNEKRDVLGEAKISFYRERLETPQPRAADQPDIAGGGEPLAQPQPEIVGDGGCFCDGGGGGIYIIPCPRQ